MRCGSIAQASQRRPVAGSSTTIDVIMGMIARPDAHALDSLAGHERPPVAEMHPVLAPGGRLGIAVWTEIENSPPFRALASEIE
jgi:hypothetical protein